MTIFVNIVTSRHGISLSWMVQWLAFHLVSMEIACSNPRPRVRFLFGFRLVDIDLRC